jgi:hypothetical protein
MKEEGGILVQLTSIRQPNVDKSPRSLVIYPIYRQIIYVLSASYSSEFQYPSYFIVGSHSRHFHRSTTHDFLSPWPFGSVESEKTILLWTPVDSARVRKGRTADIIMVDLTDW